MFVAKGLLLQWEHHQKKTFGPALRLLGQRLIKLGGSIQGELLSTDRRKILLNLIF